jgi:hypothetical protein
MPKFCQTFAEPLDDVEQMMKVGVWLCARH